MSRHHHSDTIEPRGLAMSRRHPIDHRSEWAIDPHLRVSDTERNEVSERLSRHFADGRLDQVEFSTRLDRATRATTRGDLDGLFDDLPRLGDEPAPPRARRRRLVPFLLIVVLMVVAAQSMASLAHIPWLLLVAVGLLLWYRRGRVPAPRDTGR
jgi:hypothetical protein